MSDLLLMRCPFCGGKAKADFEPDSEIYKTSEKWWVSCTECGAQTAARATEEKAILTWNDRVGERKKK